MASKVFEVMKLLESRRISFSIRRPGPLDLVFTAIQVGAVLKALEEDD